MHSDDELDELRLLVCTGNLGNAEPDRRSIASWIPGDGRVKDVLATLGLPPQYPVRMLQETLVEDFTEYDYEDRFHIIVLGMQEATFDPLGKAGVQKEKPNTAGGKASRVPKAFLKSSRSVAGMLGKNFTTLAANRDHTKNISPQQSSMFMSNAMSPTGPTSAPSTDAKTRVYGDGTEVLHALFEKQLPSYQRLVSFQRGEMRLEVFVLISGSNNICDSYRGMDLKVEVLNVAAQNTGMAGLANKGGIVAELLVNKTTRISVGTCHLEAHEGQTKYQMRCSSIADILAGTGRRAHDVSISSHYTFFIGDLNFRTELPEEDYASEEDHRIKIRALVDEQNWDRLNEIDELHKALMCQDCLVGFKTPFCNFPPTFKMERKFGYKYVEKRRPSYTDRILWKTAHELDQGVRPMAYEPIDNFVSSDHKPIRGAFALALNKDFDSPAIGFDPNRKSTSFRWGRDMPVHTGNVDKNFYHLFVSGIKCQITRQSASAPSPYIVLFSYPEEVLGQEQNIWSGFMRGLLSWLNIGGSSYVFTSSDSGSKGRSAYGFPRSSVKKSVLEADWEEEEIHAAVNKKMPDGTPINLAGAMLGISVMDNGTQSDNLLGTFSFNLANLFRKCSPKQKKPRSQRRLKERQGSIPFNLVRRASLMLGAPKAESSSDEQSDSSDDGDGLASAKIDQPLFKNGKQVGRIECTIDGWWMDEEQAQRFMERPDKNMNIGRGLSTVFRRRSTLTRRSMNRGPASPSKRRLNIVSEPNPRASPSRPELERPGLERPGLGRPGMERPGMERPGMERPGASNNVDAGSQELRTIQEGSMNSTATDENINSMAFDEDDDVSESETETDEPPVAPKEEPPTAPKEGPPTAPKAKTTTQNNRPKKAPLKAVAKRPPPKKTIARKLSQATGLGLLAGSQRSLLPKKMMKKPKRPPPNESARGPPAKKKVIKNGQSATANPVRRPPPKTTSVGGSVKSGGSDASDPVRRPPQNTPSIGGGGSAKSTKSTASMASSVMSTPSTKAKGPGAAATAKPPGKPKPSNANSPPPRKVPMKVATNGPLKRTLIKAGSTKKVNIHGKIVTKKLVKKKIVRETNPGGLKKKVLVKKPVAKEATNNNQATSSAGDLRFI
jgi:hypothetical protein